jgi:signal transduction histidine kinase
MLIAGALGARPAVAWVCYGDTAREDGAWVERLLRDPRGSAEILQRSLSAPAPAVDARGSVAVTATAAVTPLSRARRLMLLTEARSELGDEAGTAQAIELAQASLVSADSRALRDRIAFQRAMLLEAGGDVARALSTIEPLVRQLPAEAPYRLCALIDRGYLRFRRGQSAEAIDDLLLAWQLAGASGFERWQIYAGNMLAATYSVIGLYDDAWRFGNEAVRFHADGDSPQELGDAYFRRGNASLNAGNLPAAEQDFALAEPLFERSGAMSRLQPLRDRQCQLLVAARRPVEAGPVCRDALARARAVAMRDVEKLETGRLGQIELQLGRPAAALPLLDRALSDQGPPIVERLSSPLLQARSQARARLGDWRGAHDDTQRLVRVLEREMDAGQAARLAALNARFQAERREVDLQRMRAEADYANAQAAAQLRFRNLVLAACAVIVIAVLFTARQWRRRVQTDAALEAAEQRITALTRLSGGVAHEFNNVMTIVQQAAGLLGRIGPVAAVPAATTLLRDIEDAGATSAQITAQMLSFARQQHTSPARIDLAPFLEDAASALDRLAGDGVRVQLDVAPSSLAVHCDPRQLTAALMNLVSNARDALPRGGTVRIVARQHDDRRVRLDVLDDGEGMSAEVLTHATEPFYTTKDIGKGSGLGLSMVDGFVRQAGGRLEIRSAAGSGTTVTLLLPRAAKADAATPPASRT